MTKIDQIIQQLNEEVEDYKSAIIKLQRNRDFLMYLFRPQSVTKKFQRANQIIAALRQGKVTFDREHRRVQRRNDTPAVVRGWLTSYDAYLQKVLAHVAIVEQLQPLYAISWREKMGKHETIKRLLDELSVVANECQEYGDRVNVWVARANSE